MCVDNFSLRFFMKDVGKRIREQSCTRSFVIIYFNGSEKCHSIIFRLVKESKVH